MQTVCRVCRKKQKDNKRLSQNRWSWKHQGAYTLIRWDTCIIEKGIRVFDEAFKLQTNIESAIREEVAEEIIDINERQKKTSETALDYLLDEDDESNYECEYALADDFKEKIEDFDTYEMSAADIIRLLNNWLGR